MHRRITLLAVATLAFLAVCAPAQAATQPVLLGHDEFIPSRVAIKPGDTVEWTNPDPAEEHNVHFDDNTFVAPNPPAVGPWTQPRTFQAPGTFAYHCDIHGRPGGVGMAGTVYVNATGTLPPVAKLTTSPAVAIVGQTITFSGSTSTAAAGRQIVKYEWDLDGNGEFETNTGSTPSAARSYPSATTLDVKLRITDDLGLTDVTTLPLSVTTPPTASFSASPSPAKTGQTVVFDASTSTDADGTIVRYEWDLDGNGSFETDTGGTPSAARVYTTAATRTIGLRLTDDANATSTTTRQLVVTAATTAPPPSQPTNPSTPTAVPCSSLSGAKRAACMQKACASVRRSRRSACYQRSCRYLPRSKRSGCVRKSCRWVSRSKRSACMKKSCRYLEGSKQRACVRRYSRRR